MQGKITGISLGPGDPELVTLKALNALNEADFIYCPGTTTSGGTIKSKSLEILNALPVERAKIHLFGVPMMKDRSEANRVYDRVCGDMIRQVEDGNSVAVVAEGDACFYSSANYMFEKLTDSGQVVTMVAGVPAFIAAGASVGLHLVKQSERLLVIPGNVTEAELQSAMDNKYTVVIMKVPLGENVIRSFMDKYPSRTYHYFEHVGSEQEFYASDPACIMSRPFTYFSILVIMG